jgi:hypothetical protein
MSGKNRRVFREGQWQSACVIGSVIKLSKVKNNLRPTKLRSLYARRAQLDQAIQALEQLQNLRAYRPEPALLELLAANRHLFGRPANAGTRLAA